MRFTQSKKRYKLEPEAIDEVSDDLQGFLTELKAQKKNIIEARLTVEEFLLDYMTKFGEDTEFAYYKNSFLGKPYITIAVEGEPYNPLEKGTDDEFGNWTSTMIQNADYTPSYSFDRGVNTITMRFSKKGVNPIIKLFSAIVAAVAVSMLRAVLPAHIITYITNNLLTPLYDTFLGLMATVEIPLVFFSICCGIIGIGDSTVFGKIGRKMVLRFIAVIMMFTSLSGIVFSMLFTNFKDRDDSSISLKVGINLLLDMIPKSLLDPFTSGNTMQIVIIAVVMSVAIVILGSKAKTFAKITNEANSIIVYITGLISKLLPVFIFIVLLNMIWSGDIKLFADMWKPIVAFIGVLAVFLSLMIIYISAKENVSAKALIKKMLPTFLIGFGTASSVAANGECSASLHNRMGVNKRFVEFGQPTGGVIFMPSTAINFMVCSIYMATYYKVNVSLMWFIIAVVICSFVAIATPAVPGGAVAAYSVIFMQLGIPEEAIAIAVAIDILFDFVATACDGTFLQLELIRQADENKMLNYEVLRNKEI